MPDARCPNCSGTLATLRHERQAAGTQEIELHWLVCASCRHVQLHSWWFVDSEEVDRGLIRECVQRQDAPNRVSKDAEM